MSDPEREQDADRRSFLRAGVRGAALVGLGALAIPATRHAHSEDTAWQIDPALCIQCGKCASNCVLAESAVKCVHVFAMCGYCKICTGYFEPGAQAFTTDVQNQLCPTGAIKRTYVEDPYYEYDVAESLCIGCGKCVKGCGQFGNGSLQLQIRHDRCENCNECSIAVACPARAISRVSALYPYLLREGH